MGYYVIDVDYLPDNPAHKYADEYINISTLDIDGVLKAAQEREIDGIISYASDVSAPTAAYVAEKMGLCTNPYDTVLKMTRKDLFHPFLKSKDFYIPKTASIRSKSDLYNFLEYVNGDILLKPINSSGSKGITCIRDKSQIEAAFKIANKYARDSLLVAEEFVYRDGYQIAGDAFLVDGEIRIFSLANEHFDYGQSALVPIGESFPAALSKEKRKKARNVIQRALTELGMKNGAVNLDFMFTKEGEVFIIELAPRNGGNFITDAIKYASGVDLAEYTIKAAVGEDLSSLQEREMNRFVSTYIWHSDLEGSYKGISISEELKRKIVWSKMFINKGDTVHSYKNGGYGLGGAVLEFDSESQMLDMMDHMKEYYKVDLL